MSNRAPEPWAACRSAGGLQVDGHSTWKPGGPHKDIDVAVLRSEHEELLTYLHGWDLRIAYKGQLRRGPAAQWDRPKNAVWGRPSVGSAWHIDFKIEPVEGDEWVYRRGSSVRRPVAELGVIVNGIPYLAPTSRSCTRQEVLHGMGEIEPVGRN